MDGEKPKWAFAIAAIYTLATAGVERKLEAILTVVFTLVMVGVEHKLAPTVMAKYTQVMAGAARRSEAILMVVFIQAMAGAARRLEATLDPMTGRLQRPCCCYLKSNRDLLCLINHEEKDGSYKKKVMQEYLYIWF